MASVDHSGVTVVEGGNRRKGKMNPAEVEQCAHDIVNWFVRKAELIPEPLPENAIQTLQKALDVKVPEALHILLEKQNGGNMWFYEFKALSHLEIIDQLDQVSAWPRWKPDYIPFASDIDETVLMIDLDDEGAIYEYSSEGKGKLVADTLDKYLEHYRDTLLSGKCEFIEECGVCEQAIRK